MTCVKRKPAAEAFAVPRSLCPLIMMLIVALALAACATHDTSESTEQSTPRASSPQVPAPVDVLTPDSLARAVTLDNVMRHVGALQTVAGANHGNRAAGTPGYDASVDYVAGLLRAAGFRVSTPAFDYTRYDAGPVDLRADGAAVEATVLEYSPGTGRAPVTGAPVVVGGLGCAANDFPASVRDSVAVITRGGCEFVRKARAAQTAGARAVIIVNNAPEKLSGATLGTENPPTIPVVGVASGDAERITHARSISLAVTAETRKIVSRNVIAQTTTGDPSDVVLAGAHLDSVEAGPGINDNGTGTAAVLETALRLGSAPRVPHAVRFAFWGAEEDGLIGSTRYVESLDDQQRRALALYLNFDMLGSPNGGFFVYDGDDSARDGAGPGPTGSAGIERVFTRFYDTFYRGRQIVDAPTDFDGRSDYGPFIEIGVPAGGVLTGAEGIKTPEQARLWGGTAGQPFDAHYHSPGDTVANVNRDIFGINVSAVAYGVATYALSTAGPDGVPGPAERQRRPR